MHKQIYGVFHLKLALSAESDILTRGAQDGKTSSEGSHEAMQFFRARHPETGRETACIPGTTFKGVLRSTAEKVLRSFDDRLACDPFEEEPSHRHCACSHRLSAAKQNGRSWRPDETYGLLCPACRLFGSLAHAGLIEVQDAWATRAARSGEQARIAIDRLLGGAAPGMMYHMQPLTSESRFETSLRMRNFELWQLGLLGLTLRELNEGQALIGWGTRRGLGKVSVRFQDMRIRYPRALYDAAARQHTGLGTVPSAQCLMPPDRRRDLGYPVEDLWLLQDATAQNPHDWRDDGWVAFRWRDAVEIEAFLADCLEKALAPRLRHGLEGFGYQVARGG
jgi:CRISPR-associated protein Csm3